MRPSALSSLLFVLACFAGVIVGLALVPLEAPLNLFAGLGGGVLGGWILASSVKVVAAWQRMIVLRLGKFRGVCDPGLRFLVPIIDTPMLVEMRVQTIDIAQQQTILSPLVVPQISLPLQRA